MAISSSDKKQLKVILFRNKLISYQVMNKIKKWRFLDYWLSVGQKFLRFRFAIRFYFFIQDLWNRLLEFLLAFLLFWSHIGTFQCFDALMFNLNWSTWQLLNSISISTWVLIARAFQWCFFVLYVLHRESLLLWYIALICYTPIKRLWCATTFAYMVIYRWVLFWCSFISVVVCLQIFQTSAELHPLHVISYTTYDFRCWWKQDFMDGKQVYIFRVV